METSKLFVVEERIKTFKNWPFSNNDKCNIRNMAEAGFYSVATGRDDADAVKCFLCGKELDGWESHDDPMEEHKSHAAQCAFVQLEKKENDLRLTEMLSIIKQYMNNEIKRIAETGMEKIDVKGKKIKKRLFDTSYIN